MDLKASEQQSSAHVRAYQFSKLERFPRTYSPTSDYLGPGSYMMRKPSDCMVYQFQDSKKNSPHLQKLREDARMRVLAQKQICSRKARSPTLSRLKNINAAQNGDTTQRSAEKR